MKRFLLSFLLVMYMIAPLFSSTNSESQEIRVGITHGPPFVISDSVSKKGICVELWHQIADSLNITYKYIDFADYPSMMQALLGGTIDFVANPLSLTDKRLKNYRLTIPFYTSNMGVVTKPSTRIAIFTAIKHLMNWPTIKAALVLLSFVFVFALLMWLFERRANQRQFRKGFRGIFDGIWWAFVTMSTVGYGDKVPMSRAGRILTVFWMLYAVALFSVFTAEISSELTITKLQSDIKNLDDLRKIKLGTMERSGYASMLQVNKMKYTVFQTISDGFSALDDKRIDAFIYDAGVLDYIISKDKLGRELTLKRTHIQEQYFCLAANKENVELVNRINPVLLKITEDMKWERTLEIYSIKK